MKDSKLIILAIIVNGVWALPDFSNVVPITSEPPPEDDDFKFSAFFQMYSGVPPTPEDTPVPYHNTPPTHSPQPGKPTPYHTMQPNTIASPVATDMPYHTPSPTRAAQGETTMPYDTMAPTAAPVSDTVLPYDTIAPTNMPLQNTPAPYSTMSPTPMPNRNPAPTKRPTEPPVQESRPTPTAGPMTDAIPEVTWPTRTASYQYQWGAVTDGCQYKAPRVLLKCMDGGILLIDDLTNVDCEALALDIFRCAQVDQGSDAIVDFQCVGNTAPHLAAHATTLPSKATKCSASTGQNAGGSTVVAASLGRFCKNPSTGALTLDGSYSCAGDQDEAMNGDDFCTSINQCTGRNCSMFMEPISIEAFDENIDCSTPEPRQDLTNFGFNPSSLASYHLLKWTFSDRAFKCDWQVPDIEVSCRDGGLIQMVQDAAFCRTNAGGDVIVCTNPDPQSMDGRVIIELEFWCFGDDVDQLVLDARTLDVDTSTFVCEPDGLLVHGLDVSRGCGNKQSEITLFKTPDFCTNRTQFHQDICFAGFNCPTGGDMCSDVSLDTVSIDTSDLAAGACFFAEQLS